MIPILGMRNSETQRDRKNGEPQVTQLASDKARSQGPSHLCACLAQISSRLAAPRTNSLCLPDVEHNKGF